VARVIVDGAECKDVGDGDVVVCSNLACVALSSVAGIGALVSDRGGALSNLATVARELGIPAVVATRAGTSVIRDGDSIEVDGGRGVVLIPRPTD
jgi:pyruvate,water dikinase